MRGKQTKLPEYAAELDTFHRAMRTELWNILQTLPCRPGDRVLDVPCGDGFYAVCLARMLGGQSEIVAADKSSDFLHVAKDRTGGIMGVDRIRFIQANTYRLPFSDGSFDFVWCAQSLVSLADPVAAIHEMRRVLRPGGTLAVLENDEFHHLLLPWPVHLELAIQQALLDESRSRYGQASRICPGRYLRSMFQAAGFEDYKRHTHAVDRQYPLAGDDRNFLEHYCRDLWNLVNDKLQPNEAQELRRLIDPNHDEYMLNQADFDMTCLNIVCQGRKPVA